MLKKNLFKLNELNFLQTTLIHFTYTKMIIALKNNSQDADGFQKKKFETMKKTKQ